MEMSNAMTPTVVSKENQNIEGLSAGINGDGFTIQPSHHFAEETMTPQSDATEIVYSPDGDKTTMTQSPPSYHNANRNIAPFMGNDLRGPISSQGNPLNSPLWNNRPNNITFNCNTGMSMPKYQRGHYNMDPLTSSQANSTGTVMVHGIPTVQVSAFRQGWMVNDNQGQYVENISTTHIPGDDSVRGHTSQFDENCDEYDDEVTDTKLEGWYQENKDELDQKDVNIDIGIVDEKNYKSWYHDPIKEINEKKKLQRTKTDEKFAAHLRSFVEVDNIAKNNMVRQMDTSLDTIDFENERD